MDQVVLQLGILEIFFITTTIISLILNLLQWKDRRAFRNPLTNSLVALFNDIKSKTVNSTFVYNTIFHANNPHADIKTLRWEYGIYSQEVMTAYQGFQEAVVGLLRSLNPDDKDGQLVFRATEYGLNKEEKEDRQEMRRKFKEQSSGSSVISDDKS